MDTTDQLLRCVFKWDTESWQKWIYVIYGCLCLVATMISLTDASQRIENYLYDQNGNLLGAVYSGNVVLRFNYNALNKLSRYSNLINGHQYQYVYTANGQRAQKRDFAGMDSVYFYYDQKSRLLNERFFAVPSQSYWSEYFFKERTIQDDNSPIESIVEFSLIIRKNSATTVIISKGVSNKISRFLDDYGMQSNEKRLVNQIFHIRRKHLWTDSINRDAETSLMGFLYNPFVYGGGYYDKESGLNFQQARYYDAKIQRFISQDLKNLINRYGYANANPVMNYDPSGHNAVSVIKKAIHSDTGILTLNLVGLAGSFALGAGGVFLIEKKLGVNFISLGVNSAVGLQSGIVGMEEYIQFNNESGEKKSESKEIAFGSGIIATSSVLLSVFALAGKSAMSSKIKSFANEGGERIERSIVDVGISEFRGLGKAPVSIGNVTESVKEQRVTEISALPLQEASLPHLNPPQIKKGDFNGRQEFEDGQVFSSRSSGPIVQSKVNQEECFGCLIL